MSKPIKKILGILLMVLIMAGCGTSQYYFNETYEQAKKNYQDKNYAQAQDLYQQFIKENPDNTMSEVAMYYLADSYRLSGDKGKAKETYQKLIDKYKDSFWVDTAKKDLESLK